MASTSRRYLARIVTGRMNASNMVMGWLAYKVAKAAINPKTPADAPNTGPNPK